MPNARARLLTLSSLLIVVLVAGTFVARIAPLRGFLERIFVPMALALPMCLAALGLGGLLRLASLRALGERAHSQRLVTLCEDFALGLPLFGTACFLVALVDTSSLLLGCPLVLCAALGVVSLVRFSRSVTTPPALSGAALLCVALAAALGLVIAQLPPLTLDEVAYHLAVPRAWVLAGHVVELPLNSHSYFPFGVESAALPLLAAAGHTGAIAFHFVVLASFLVTLGLLAASLSEHGVPRGTMLALIAVASTPALVFTSGTAWIDAPLLALSVGLAGSLARAQRADFSAPSLVPVTLFVAAGTLTKYTWAGVLVVGFGAALLSVRARRAPVLRLSACAALGLLLGSVFFVRNLLWTGNPVAPFLDPATPHVAAFNQGGSPLELALNYLYDPLMVDESLGALLLSFSLVFLLVQAAFQAEPFARALGALSLAMLLGVGATGAAGRLLLPFATLAGALGAVGLARIVHEHGRLGRALTVTALGAALVQLAFVLTALPQYEPLSITGREVAQLTHARPAYPAMRFLDEHLPEGSRTLVLGLHESYWFEHDVRTAGNFDGPRMAAYLRASSARELAERLRRDGFSHVALYKRGLLVGDAPAEGRKAESKTTLDPRTAALLRATMREHAQQLAEGEGVTLLGLR